MSKKSRRRNRRLLALAALAGGAALAGRNKRIRATDSPGNEFAKARAAMTDLPDYNPPKKWITKKDVLPKTKVVSPASTGSTGNTITRTSGITLSPSGQKIGAGGVDSSGLSRGEKAQILAAKANAPKGIIRPGDSIMEHLSHPRINQAGSPIIRQYKKGGSVKKAKVTGIAKRGFGRALMKGRK